MEVSQRIELQNNLFEKKLVSVDTFMQKWDRFGAKKQEVKNQITQVVSDLQGT